MKDYSKKAMRFTKPENKLFSLNIGLIFLLFGSSLISVSCQTKEQKVAAASKKCQQLLDKDDLDAATKCYGAAILTNPSSSGEISKAGEAAVFKKCNEFWLSKNFEKSIICYEGVKALNANNSNIWFPLAHSYYEYYKLLKDKDVDLLNKAEEAVKIDLKMKPDDPKPHGLYGSILREYGDWAAAEKEYKELLKLDPKAGYFWVSLAYVQEKAGKHTEAIQSCEQSLKIDPNDIDALYVLGEIYSRIGETSKAVNTFERLLEIKPDYEDTRQRLENLKKTPDKKPIKSRAKTAG